MTLEPPLRRDLAPLRCVLEVARRMGVVMVEAPELVEEGEDEDDLIAALLPGRIPGLSWRPRATDLPAGFDPALLTDGPAGWTWAGHGIVVAEPGYRFLVQGADDWAYLLHEVSHAVWTPPGKRPDEVGSETEGQDQWEYAVVRSFFPRSCWRHHIEFQGESSRPCGRLDEFGLRAEVRDGHEYKDPRKLASWREGKKLAVRVGALDAEGRPTWKRPDYEEYVRWA